MAVLSLPEAKTHLNIPTSNTTNDGELVGFIEAAEQSIADECGPLVPTTVTERVDGQFSSLKLHTTPVLSIISVTPVGGTALSPSELAELDVRSGGIITMISGGWFGSRRYDVVYQAGRTSVPANLLLGIKEHIRYLWESQLGNAPSSGALPEDQFGTAAPLAALARRVEQLIRPYKQLGP
jgi:hypothetical protein